MNGNPWTGCEIDLLRRLWPTTPWDKLHAMLPRHTRKSITRLASDLKIKRRRTTRIPHYTIFVQLREARERQNLTRRMLSDIVGYHLVNLQRWETGVSVPSVQRLADWAEALGFELSLRKAA